MKNVIIVGASSGIGASLKEILQDKNEYTIYATSRDISKFTFHQNVNVLTFDSQNGFSDGQLPEIIDALIYCPGTINLKPFNRLSENDFKNDFDVNVLGLVKAVQACLPGLKKSESASIIAFSTVAVQLGMSFHASVAASKAAVEGLIKSLAAEFAPKIRANVIAPSLTNTSLAEKLLNTPEKLEAGNKRHPLQRIGNPNEIAQLVAFLISENSSWITGQIIKIDGGMSSIKI